MVTESSLPSSWKHPHDRCGVFYLFFFCPLVYHLLFVRHSFWKRIESICMHFGVAGWAWRETKLAAHPQLRVTSPRTRWGQGAEGTGPVTQGPHCDTPPAQNAPQPTVYRENATQGGMLGTSAGPQPRHTGPLPHRGPPILHDGQACPLDRGCFHFSEQHLLTRQTPGLNSNSWPDDSKETQARRTHTGTVTLLVLVRWERLWNTSLAPPAEFSSVNQDGSPS